MSRNEPSVVVDARAVEISELQHRWALWSSCQEVWTFLPEDCGSSHGIASEEFDTEEFAAGDEFAATEAFTADTYVSTP